MCTYIYFANIGSFDGDEMPRPPTDLGIDPNDNQEMANAKDHEAGVDRPGPHGASVPPFAMCRPNIR